jgi:thioesterase domain-containing protein/acyl carrier protein
MTLDELFAELSQRGVKLWVDGERLGIRAPKGVLTTELRDSLAERKAEILAFLQQANAATNTQLPPLLPVTRDGNLPLSLAQERLWFLEQLTPGTSVYNLVLAFRLTGSLNQTAMEQSLREIVRRQEILRTSFPAVDGQPIPIISPESSLRLPVIDLRELPTSERDAQAQRLANEEARQPFDLAQEPLWRVKLLCLAEEEHLFVLTLHHIISDGWSFSVFLRELTELYKAFAAGEPSPLPELPIQYADFASWQRQWLQGERLESQLNYWKQQLSGNVPPLQLPTARPYSTAQTYQGARQSLVLPKNLTDELKSLSQREGVTLFITLMAGFQTLLHRYTGQEDIILCSPVVGRNQSETEGLIGYFNNILVMRTDLSGNPSFRELLSRVRRVATEAYEHQDVPLQQIAELPNLIRTPLSRGMFALQNAPSDALKLPGIMVTPFDVHNGTANFDLSLSMEETGETVTGVLNYKSDLFNVATITEMLENFQFLLETIITNPEQQLSSLPLLTKTEPHQSCDNNDNAASLQKASPETFIAPRNQLERQLTKIWENVLEIQPIGVRDNFFDLGGHSMLAVRLFAQIEKIHGKNLPLATLFQASTVEQLANLLRQDEASISWSSLVPIQPDGSKPPLFCIHAVGGNVLTYVALSHHLGSDQPVYGLQAQGIDGKGAFHTSIEEMATHYVKEIRTFQPTGPYMLAGLSGGGVIAFEMAQQLVAQGQKVAVLAFFDTLSPKYIKDTGKAEKEYRKKHGQATGSIFRKNKWLRKRRGQWRRALRGLSHFLHLEPKDKLPYLVNRAKKFKQNAKYSIELMTYKLNPRPGQPLPYRLRESAITQALKNAVRNYVEQVYPGKVTLFRATELRYRASGELDNDELGWDEFAGGGLEIHKVPGNHSNIVAEPNVQVLAPILKDCIDRALAEEDQAQESNIESLAAQIR